MEYLATFAHRSKEIIMLRVILCVLFLFCGCKEDKKSPTKQIRSVKCIQIKKTTTVPVIKVNGTTQPYRTVNLSFRISGVVDEKKVALGDEVKKDQVLLTLEEDDFNLQVQRAKQALALAKSRLVRIKAKARPEEIVAAEAQVKAAQKSYENAQQEYQSQISLAKSQIISQITLNALKTKAEVAYENVKVAKQELEILKQGARLEDIQLAIDQVASAEIEKRIALQNLKYLKLKSPFPGVVTAIPTEIKEFISPGRTAVSIDDLYKIKLEVFVPASQISSVKKGQMVDIDIESVAKRSYRGKVTYVGTKAEQISKTFSVEIEIPNPKFAIRAGMFATATIQTGEPQQTILLPPQCIRSDAVGDYVFVLTSTPDQDGVTQVKRNNIKHGHLVKDLVEVTSGIEENAWVVIEGQHYVNDASSVYVHDRKNIKIGQ